MLVGLVLHVVIAILRQEVTRGINVATLLLHDVGKLHVTLGDGGLPNVFIWLP